MIKNVVLIYPDSRRYSGFLSTHKLPGLVTSHAGLTILAQILEREGCNVRVYDEQITPFSERMIEGADLVGVSVQTLWAPQAYRIARQVRRAGIPLVLGGVHATLNPDEAIEHTDYLVRGEGENTLPELVKALGSGEALDDIAGLSFRKNGKIQHNPARALLTTAELDQVPFPRLDLIEGITDTQRFPLNDMVYFTMATRGCDQACTYCSITRVFGRALRHRSVDNIMEELGSLWDPERQFLFFMDDSLANNVDFLKELLDRLLREDMVPRLGWHSQLRADVSQDAELLRLMQLTNCTFVTCGFESVNPRSLKSLGKGQSPADVKRAVARLTAHDIIVNGFFMFGTDHDGPDCFAETVRFAKESGCMLAGFMPLRPFPGTATFKRLDREGRIFTKDWELYDVQHVVYHPKNMSAWDLYRRTLACYPYFYATRPLLRHVRLLFTKRPSPAMIGIGASWPFAKQYCWTREVMANTDYLRELRKVGRNGQRFPDLNGHRLWAKDLLSGRTLRAARSRSSLALQATR